MTKAKIFKKNLLLTQEETAILLGVNRSQWAMYEIGQRDIPGFAKMKLATLLETVEALSVADTADFPNRMTQETNKEKIIKTQIKENKLQIIRLQRKIALMERNFQEAQNTFWFVQLLQEKIKENASEIETMVLETIQAKALALLDKNGLDIVAKNQLKLDALVIHTNQMEVALKK
jgi:transcriptional regulator with XRE-family HTH domain